MFHPTEQWDGAALSAPLLPYILSVSLKGSLWVSERAAIRLIKDLLD